MAAAEAAAVAAAPAASPAAAAAAAGPAAAAAAAAAEFTYARQYFLAADLLKARNPWSFRNTCLRTAIPEALTEIVLLDFFVLSGSLNLTVDHHV